MERSFRELEKLAERLKNEYPKGTRIELERMGSDPRPIESGTRGTVDHVDDLGTIHCVFDNGRCLGIIMDEDDFHKLTPSELWEENSKNSEIKQIQFIDKINAEVFSKTDWRKLGEEYKSGSMEYPTEILRRLHEAFLEVYPPLLEDGAGMVTVPGMVEVATGAKYVALLDIDVDSSGEHWGTTFITPAGVLDDHEEKHWNLIKPFIPYKYWYTPCLEHDCHVDWDECPHDIRQVLSDATGDDFFQEGGMTL